MNDWDVIISTFGDPVRVDFSNQNVFSLGDGPVSSVEHSVQFRSLDFVRLHHWSLAHRLGKCVCSEDWGFGSPRGHHEANKVVPL